MPFLKVNDLDLSVMVESFESRGENVESFSRAQNNDLHGRTYARKGALQFETDVMPAAKADALARWLEGDCYRWNFSYRTGYLGVANTEFRLTENTGGPAWDSGVSSATVPGQGSAPVFGRAMLRGTTFSTATLLTRDPQNWTFSWWQASQADATKRFGCVVCRSGVLDSWEGSASLATAATLHSFSSDPSADKVAIKLHAKTLLANTAATVYFGAASFFNFPLTEAQVSAQFLSGGAYEVQAPFVMAEGDGLGTSPLTRRAFKATVVSQDADPAVLANGYDYAARRLLVRLVER